MTVKLIISLIIGYIFGSINFAVFISKNILKKDVRTMGSGNAGATNVARVFGFGVAIATFAGDILKTVASVTAAKYIGGELCTVFAAVGCMIGHAYPVFYGFRGGKGVTVAATIAFLLDFRAFLIIAAVFFTVAFTTKIVSLSSILAAGVFPFAMIILGGKSLPVILLTFFVGGGVIFLHRINISRLIKGTEPKFKAKSANNVLKNEYGEKK